jgi:CRP-like cAMP-binding protein
VQPVIDKLMRTRLFANLPGEGLADLLSSPGPAQGEMMDTVPARAGDLVVLLEGGLHMLAKEGAGDHLAILSVDAGAREPGILYTIPHGAVVRLTRASTYLIIDGDRLDALVSAGHEQRSLAGLDDEVRERAASLMRASPFKRLTFEQVVRCAEVMRPVEVSAGEEIVREGEGGDYFYVIENGQAEVFRGSGGGRQAVAMLGHGAAFGEEALLQGGVRNATVRMLRDGRLLRLDQADFNRLLKAELVAELAPTEAAALIRFKRAEVIDCRTEAEWELWRLPRARLMPLETIRERSRGLDPAREYLVYCRTGRRAVAAVFLMRQQGIRAHALKGGAAAWPYEFEGATAGA